MRNKTLRRDHHLDIAGEILSRQISMKRISVDARNLRNYRRLETLTTYLIQWFGRRSQ